jgi:Cys-tRNA(Pro)/Cys-tRNA(Cys) deacylase
MGKKNGGSKTAPMRALDAAGVPCTVHEHAHKQITCEGVAEDLGVPLSQVVKSMIVQRSDGRFVLFVLAGDKRLSLKKITTALGDRGAVLAGERDVLRVTGYQVGSVSVAGFRRDDIAGYLDRGVLNLPQVVISAGRPDAGIILAPAGLLAVMKEAQVGDYAEG